MNTERPKTCATCAHRNGTLTFGTCMRSGFYLTTERNFPTECGRNFTGWSLREPLIIRIQKAIYKP